MDKKISPQVKILTVEESGVGQRIDNFLFTRLKGLPKSRIYKAIRQGEVRINKKRAKPETKLSLEDQVRIPPFRLSQTTKPIPGQRKSQYIQDHIMYEDNDFIVLNKPSGVAVHGGSGISFGVIEALRHLRPQQKFMELAHRLDKETSGCLLIVKKSSLLKEIHRLLLERAVTKTYLLLVAGVCHFTQKVVDAPLQKNILRSGERVVVVDAQGKPAKTIFRRLKAFDHSTLLEARPITGRTHQIRVHAAYIGHPIIGDEKYGDQETNKDQRKRGITQLCLHSASIAFKLETRASEFAICACLLEPWLKLVEN